MSRHRDVRCMNYTDEYEGYEDVYGHSVEDDYCVSPGAEQFMFDRNKQANISSFITEPNIAEGDEEEPEEQPASFKNPALSELETAKLMSCIETIRNVVGDTISESDLNKKIIELDYNAEAVLHDILNAASPKNSAEEQATNKKPLDFPLGLSLNKIALGSKTEPPAFTIPKLKFQKRPDLDQDQVKKNISVSTLSNLQTLSNFNSLNASNTIKECSSLSEMISSHNKLNFPGLTSLSDLRTLGKDSKIPQCSSLSDLIAGHKKLNSPKSTTEFSQITNSPSNSLLGLASHHLKKSGNSSISFKKEGLNTRGFSLNTEKENLKSTFSENTMNTIAKNISSLQLNQKDDEVDKKSSVEIDDEWEIDLSCALKTVDLAKSQSPKVENPKSVNSENSLMSQSNLTQSNFGTMCNFNLHSLQKTELEFALKTASPMGKVLCRKWKTKTPRVRKKAWYFQTSPKITRFDFAEMSPDSKILQYLRKKI